jgi:multisubunit Na+/H+ antiporter MnhE subunit
LFPDWFLHDLVGLITGWILKMIGQRMWKIGFTKLLRRLAVWVVLNPKVLGAIVLAPSFLFMLTTANQVMAHPEALLIRQGSQTAQIMLLSFAGVTLGTTLVAAPSPRRRYSHIHWIK